jgi:hypothetical protein
MTAAGVISETPARDLFVRLTEFHADCNATIRLRRRQHNTIVLTPLSASSRVTAIVIDGEDCEEWSKLNSIDGLLTPATRFIDQHLRRSLPAETTASQYYVFHLDWSPKSAALVAWILIAVAVFFVLFGVWPRSPAKSEDPDPAGRSNPG